MKPEPSYSALAAGAVRWGMLYTVVFFVTFPFWSGPLLSAVRWVLETLDKVGG